MSVVNVFSTSTTENFSRHTLLAWVNDCLQSNLTKIEEMSTGAAYCQLTDLLFPGKVKLNKVKWNSRQEVDWVTNWRILQESWKSIGITKPVTVQTLLRGKFQDNFEFLQWFKKFFDVNYAGHTYDPLAARNFEEFPAALPGGGAHKTALNSTRATPVTSLSSSRRSVFPSSQSSTTTPLSQTPSGRLSIAGQGRLSIAGQVARPAPSSATHNATNAATTRSKRYSMTPSQPTTTAIARPRPSTATNSARLSSHTTTSSAASNAELVKLREENANFKQSKSRSDEEITKLSETNSLLERERNFYYKKLREIEKICQNIVESEKIPIKVLLEILYDTQELSEPVKDDISSQNELQQDESSQKEIMSTAVTQTDLSNIYEEEKEDSTYTKGHNYTGSINLNNTTMTLNKTLNNNTTIELKNAAVNTTFTKDDKNSTNVNVVPFDENHINSIVRDTNDSLLADVVLYQEMLAVGNLDKFETKSTNIFSDFDETFYEDAPSAPN